jgi:hypothetical protein
MSRPGGSVVPAAAALKFANPHDRTRNGCAVPPGYQRASTSTSPSTPVMTFTSC